MKSVIVPIVVGSSLLLLTASGARAELLDLSTWSRQGFPANGTWTVSGDHHSVTQQTHRNVSFFVSGAALGEGRYHGYVTDTTTGDDYIGFVLGYSHPVAPADAQGRYDFVLLDWKGANQGEAREGFSLVRVNGTFTDPELTTDIHFWNHQDDGVFDVLATDYNTTHGWAVGTAYEFTIDYSASHLAFAIKGGTGVFKNGLTIFDVAGTFASPGRFGFYTGGEEGPRFYNVDFTPIPEPGTLALLAVGAMTSAIAAGWWRRRKVA